MCKTCFENRQPIETVPRDGTLVIIGHEDVGWFHMQWNPTGSNAIFQLEPVGIWETPDGSMTWSEAGGYGPAWWQPVGTLH